MNKKIILGLGASLLLTSSLLAFGPQSTDCQGFKGSKSQNKMMKKSMKHNKKGAFANMVMNLDLSDKQRTQIKEIIMASVNSMPNPTDAFSNANFDKKKFIKIANEKRDGMIKRRAQMMAKVYKVLNSLQKKDLKTMMDMKNIMMKKMIQNKLSLNPPMPMRTR